MQSEGLVLLNHGMKQVIEGPITFMQYADINFQGYFVRYKSGPLEDQVEFPTSCTTIPVTISQSTCHALLGIHGYTKQLHFINRGL